MVLSPEEEERLREQVRKSLEEEEKRRLAEEGGRTEEQQRQLEREKERIRREEEEKFYQAKGPVKRSRSGKVERITPEEAKDRKKRVIRKRGYRRRGGGRGLASKLRKRKLDLALGAVVAVFLIFLYMMITGRAMVGKGIVVGRGSVQVESSEPGAIVYIDGKPTPYITNCTISNVLRGSHTITVSKPGYFPSPLSRTIEVSPGQRASVEFFLSPVVLVGSILVSSNLEGADIFLDGAPTGFKTDFELDNVPVGTHTISISEPGYSVSPPFRRIEIVEDRTAKASFILKEKEKRKYGSIVVSANVEGATIFVDGEATGRATDTTLRNIPVGMHTISISKPGYTCSPSSVKVEVSWDKPAPVSFELIRQFGRIDVNTTPVGGAIYIDGEFKGIGRYTGKHEVGEHTVSFGLVKGYLTPVQQEISLAPSGASITGTYIKSKLFSAHIDDSGRLAEENCKKVAWGYRLPNEELVEDEKNGPAIGHSPEHGFYYWKLGRLFRGTREGVGYHFVEMAFDFDQDIDPKADYYLQMWGYATDDNIGLYIQNITRIEIDINGKTLVSDYSPRFNVNRDKALSFEKWKINDLLTKGENRIVVTTGRKSECYFWLRKLRVIRR